MSNKQKRKELLQRRETKKAKKEREELALGLRKRTIIKVDPSKVFSRSVLPDIPDFYYDRKFKCVDCGVADVWTAKRQQWYYEEAKGEIEGQPIRCHDCRKKEKERKAEVRRLQLEGLENKKRFKTKQGSADNSAPRLEPISHSNLR